MEITTKQLEKLWFRESYLSYVKDITFEISMYFNKTRWFEISIDCWPRWKVYPKTIKDIKMIIKYLTPPVWK